MRNRPLIITLAVMGLLAVGLTAMTMMNSGTPTSAPDPNLTTVATATPVPTKVKQVIALRDIPPRTIIKREMLMENEVDSGSVDPTSLSSMEDAVGKLSNSGVKRGEPLTISSVVVPLRRVVPANFEVPDGLRAVAVYVDPNTTAAGLIDVGDRVDVIATNKVTFKPQDTERYKQVYVGIESYAIGRTVAQDLLVLAVDTSLQRQPTPVATPTTSAVPGVPAPPAPAAPTPAVAAPKIRVLLASTTSVAARLIASQGQGELNLIIRNPNSREQAAPVEVREYPTRVVNIPKRPTPNPNAVARSFANEMRDAQRSSSGESNFVRPTDVPQLAPLPPANPLSAGTRPSGGMMGGGGTMGGMGMPPSGPSGSEVTVIRGTDKTKVTVPSN